VLSRSFCDEGSARRRVGNPGRQIAAKEHGLGNGYRSVRGQTLKAEPSECLRGGTNPEARECRRLVGRLRKPEGGQRRGRNPCCRESLARALKGKEPRKALGLNPTMMRGHTLKPAEAQERIFGSFTDPTVFMMRASMVFRTPEARRNRIGVVIVEAQIL